MSETTIPVSQRMRVLLLNAEQAVQTATLKRDALIEGLLASADIEPQAVQYTLNDEGLVVRTAERSTGAQVPTTEQ